MAWNNKWKDDFMEMDFEIPSPKATSLQVTAISDSSCKPYESDYANIIIGDIDESLSSPGTSTVVSPGDSPAIKLLQPCHPSWFDADYLELDDDVWNATLREMEKMSDEELMNRLAHYATYATFFCFVCPCQSVEGVLARRAAELREQAGLPPLGTEQQRRDEACRADASGTGSSGESVASNSPDHSLAVIQWLSTAAVATPDHLLHTMLMEPPYEHPPSTPHSVFEDFSPDELPDDSVSVGMSANDSALYTEPTNGHSSVSQRCEMHGDMACTSTPEMKHYLKEIQKFLPSGFIPVTMENESHHPHCVFHPDNALQLRYFFKYLLYLQGREEKPDWPYSDTNPPPMPRLPPMLRFPGSPYISETSFYMLRSIYPTFHADIFHRIEEANRRINVLMQLPCPDYPRLPKYRSIEVNLLLPDGYFATFFISNDKTLKELKKYVWQKFEALTKDHKQRYMERFRRRRGQSRVYRYARERVIKLMRFRSSPSTPTSPRRKKSYPPQVDSSNRSRRGIFGNFINYFSRNSTSLDSALSALELESHSSISPPQSPGTELEEIDEISETSTVTSDKCFSYRDPHDFSFQSISSHNQLTEFYDDRKRICDLPETPPLYLRLVELIGNQSEKELSAQISTMLGRPLNQLDMYRTDEFLSYRYAMHWHMQQAVESRESMNIDDQIFYHFPPEIDEIKKLLLSYERIRDMERFDKFVDDTDPEIATLRSFEYNNYQTPELSESEEIEREIEMKRREEAIRAFQMDTSGQYTEIYAKKAPYRRKELSLHSAPKMRITTVNNELNVLIERSDLWNNMVLYRTSPGFRSPLPSRPFRRPTEHLRLKYGIVLHEDDQMTPEERTRRREEIKRRVEWQKRLPDLERIKTTLAEREEARKEREEIRLRQEEAIRVERSKTEKVDLFYGFRKPLRPRSKMIVWSHVELFNEAFGSIGFKLNRVIARLKAMANEDFNNRGLNNPFSFDNNPFEMGPSTSGYNDMIPDMSGGNNWCDSSGQEDEYDEKKDDDQLLSENGDSPKKKKNFLRRLFSRRKSKQSPVHEASESDPNNELTEYGPMSRRTDPNSDSTKAVPQSVGAYVESHPQYLILKVLCRMITQLLYQERVSCKFSPSDVKFQGLYQIIRRKFRFVYLNEESPEGLPTTVHPSLGVTMMAIDELVNLLNPNNFLLKICGVDQFLVGDYELADYEFVRNTISKGKVPHLELVSKKVVIKSMGVFKYIEPSFIRRMKDTPLTAITCSLLGHTHQNDPDGCTYDFPDEPRNKKRAKQRLDHCNDCEQERDDEEAKNGPPPEEELLQVIIEDNQNKTLTPEQIIQKVLSVNQKNQTEKCHYSTITHIITNDEEEDEDPNLEPLDPPVIGNPPNDTLITPVIDMPVVKKPDGKSSKTPDEKISNKQDEKSSKTPDEKNSKTSDEKSSTKQDELSSKTPDEKNFKTSDEKSSTRQDEKSSKTSDEINSKMQEEKRSKKEEEKGSKTPDEKSFKKQDEKSSKKQDENNSEKSSESNSEKRRVTFACKHRLTTEHEDVGYGKMELYEDPYYHERPYNQYSLDQWIARGLTNQKLICIWKINQVFRLRVLLATYVNVRDADQIYAMIGLYHGNEPLCSPQYTKKVSTLNPRWDQMVEFPDMVLFDLPLATKLCITLIGESIRKRPTERWCIGWINLPVFNYRRLMICGRLTLGLWNKAVPADGYLNPNGILGANPNRFSAPRLQIEFDSSPFPIVYPPFHDCIQYGYVANKYEFNVRKQLKEIVKSHPLNTQIQLDSFEFFGKCNLNRLVRDATKGWVLKQIKSSLLKSDPLVKLSEQEKDFFWRERHLIEEVAPDALPNVLESMRWGIREEVNQCYALLETWPTVSVDTALILLTKRFPDPEVRKFAIRSLDEKLTTGLMLHYLLQFVQLLRNEPFLNNELACMLLRRSLLNRRFGNLFFWHIRSQMKDSPLLPRWCVLLEMYLRGLPRSALLATYTQVCSLEEIERISKETIDDADRKGSVLRQLRVNDVFQTVNAFSNPLDITVRLADLQLHKLRVMDSAKRPLWLEWKNRDKLALHSGLEINAVIFKSGDDLRQDMLTLQLLRIMDLIWRREGFDLRLLPYNCLATGNQVGLIEVVPKSKTVMSIQRVGGRMAALQVDSSKLHKWIREWNRDNYEGAIDNFTRSCAGYCVATFILGIGDRNPDNIMINQDGQIFHIDFGHFLGHFKKKFGISRERVPFVLTYDFLQVISKGSENPLHSKEFAAFQQLCRDAYGALHDNATLLIALFTMMLGTGIPELQTLDDVQHLRETLQVGKDRDEAIEFFESQLDEAHGGAWTTKIDWFFHHVNH